jgi:CheY-like chemotaxis protein
MTPSRHFTVVVVEDSPSDAVMIEEGLRRAGGSLDIVLLKDGEQASRRLGAAEDADAPGRGRPDLIILDLQLPKRSGSQLLDELKLAPALKEVPMVILSGSTKTAEVWGCYDHGANLVVQKPMDAELFMDLVAAIRHYYLDKADQLESVRAEPLGAVLDRLGENEHV